VSGERTIARPSVRENHLVAFAERVLALLDQGSFVATYKYAVLLALMDLCLEKTRRSGGAPESITTRQLAEKVIELYWPQTVQFGGKTLRQNAGGQARIVTDICRFRASLSDASVSLHRGRAEAPAAFERLAREVEWALIHMPLPRLQVVGGETDRLLYDIAWGPDIERNRRAVSAYQRSGASTFDNRILLLPGVGDHLVTLNGLLRPLLHRAWSAMVAQLNGLQQSKLESFLFGVERSALTEIRPFLLDLQRGGCFYCGRRMSGPGEVDHFIPWARYPDNGVDNLVVADRRCNGAKRDFLAADSHLERWREHNSRESSTLAQVARDLGWEAHADDTLRVARGIYLRLPERARVWLRADQFCAAAPARFREILT
jgi:5-methylcytosine-specific restriction endonuclease McrA